MRQVIDYNPENYTWKMFKKLVETFLNIGGRPTYLSRND